MTWPHDHRKPFEVIDAQVIIFDNARKPISLVCTDYVEVYVRATHFARQQHATTVHAERETWEHEKTTSKAGGCQGRERFFFWRLPGRATRGAPVTAL
jgi:hypothetical protein